MGVERKSDKAALYPPPPRPHQKRAKKTWYKQFSTIEFLVPGFLDLYKFVGETNMCLKIVPKITTYGDRRFSLSKNSGPSNNEERETKIKIKNNESIFS